MSCLAFAQSTDLIDADRPGLADTSTVIGRGRIQIESGLQWETNDGEHSFFFPTLFRVGLSDRFEARLEGNYRLGSMTPRASVKAA